MDDRLGKKHPGLDGFDGKIAEEPFPLGFNEGGGHLLDRRDTIRILSGEAADEGGSEDLIRCEGEEVGLAARAAPAIGGRNGQCYRDFEGSIEVIFHGYIVVSHHRMGKHWIQENQMAEGESHHSELFSSSDVDPDDSQKEIRGGRPLAVRMRPRRLEEILGQEHLTAEDSLLPSLIRSNQFGSLLFYGPPGCGKTTLAEVIAKETESHCVKINAVLSNVAELRDILRMARYRQDTQTLLFIDEIHRFNKAQQDLLLPDVEEGNIRLIGATTHNPGFYIIPPLLSRSHLFKLEPVREAVAEKVLREAMKDCERGLGNHRCHVKPEVIRTLAAMGDGDLRRSLNALETLVLSQPMGSEIGEEALESFARERQIRYDANEDEHYDTASAFIKSMRGGDPDAALYWMAKMLAGGEDPRFIARRMVILASEDIGLADSRALLVANAAFEACEKIGQPECELNLAHACLFLATAPKSNSATEALAKVKSEIKTKRLQQVPLWLRDSHGSANRKAGHGEDYLYSHHYEEAISGQDYMLEPKRFYHPGREGAEKSIGERLRKWKDLKRRIKENQRKESD